MSVNCNLNLAPYIDHTILKPDAMLSEIHKIVDEALKYGFYAVCINPCWVKNVKEMIHSYALKTASVVGFPLGANHSLMKTKEAYQAVMDGADEIDMVMNIGALKERDYHRVMRDIQMVVLEVPETVVKVIIETDLLTEHEKVTAAKIVADAGAHFVKTSTGMLKTGIGATEADVKLLKETVQNYGVLVKASGGIKNYDQAVRLISAGADRLGTSCGVELVTFRH